MTASSPPCEVLARAVTHALVGLEPRKVEVEAHLQPGIPGFAIVGLADRACQEAKHRVRSGVVSAALEWPVNRRITVNLAPAALRKEGSGFDLPISLAVLGATRQLPPERLAEHAAVGELALDGRIRPVAGTLAVAEGARRAGLTHVVCAAESAPEAALAGIAAGARATSRRGRRVLPRRDRRSRVPAARRGRGGTESLPISRTCAGRSARAARSRSLRSARTTCSSWGRRGRARRCWPDASPASCRRSATPRRSRSRESTPSRESCARRRRCSRSHRSGRRTTARRRPPSSVAGRALAPAKFPSRITACFSSTSCPSSRARSSSRCGSHSRTGSSRSPASEGTRSSRLASSSSAR